MNKDHASRNKTLVIADAEKELLLKSTITLTDVISGDDLVNKLIHQDVFEVIKYLPDAFVDLLIVDPPYNLTKQFNKTKFSKLSDEDYETWLEQWLPQLKRCLKPNASIYVCCDWQSSSSVQKVLQKHFFIKNRITWEREKGRGAKNNWKNCSEDIWFCTNSKTYYFNVDAVKLRRKVIAPYRDSSGNPKDWTNDSNGNYRLTYPSNLWTDISVPFWSMSENTEHPTQKPEKLIAKLILASSQVGDMIFDPFMGSGTTCVTANKLDRKYLGIEIDDMYCCAAVKRIEKSNLVKSIQGYDNGYFLERNTKG